MGTLIFRQDRSVFFSGRDEEAAMIALCIFGTDAIASFLRGHAVLLGPRGFRVMAVCGIRLFSKGQFSRHIRVASHSIPAKLGSPGGIHAEDMR
jgi:hypothetical protein